MTKKKIIKKEVSSVTVLSVPIQQVPKQNQQLEASCSEPKPSKVCCSTLEPSRLLVSQQCLPKHLVPDPNLSGFQFHIQTYQISCSTSRLLIPHPSLPGFLLHTQAFHRLPDPHPSLSCFLFYTQAFQKISCFTPKTSKAS